MKFFDKLILKLFSLIILALGIVSILLMTGILSVEMISVEVLRLTGGETTIEVLIGVLAILMLLSVKGLFFTSKVQDKALKDGIILENTNGKLVISKESLENLVSSVTKDIPGADTIASRTLLDKHRNLIVNVTVATSKDVMIKDVSNEVQAKVKDAMKKTADLDVKEVNIRIKNITSKKVKGLPDPDKQEEMKDEEVNEEEIADNENGEE